jgi:hypothetical protein
VCRAAERVAVAEDVVVQAVVQEVVQAEAAVVLPPRRQLQPTRAVCMALVAACGFQDD